jgi:hypothetical protein
MCCSRQFGEVAPQPDILGRRKQNCDRAAIATAEYSRTNCIGWNCRKFEYMIGPIDAIPEQSFPSRNSIGKVGFYVLQ